MNDGVGGSTQIPISAGGSGYIVDDAGDPQCRTTCDPSECGPIADGCGAFIQCGSCTLPETCGGAGVPSHCGVPTSTCVPKTCAQIGMNCGLQGDGCGAVINCWPGAGNDAGAAQACPDPAMQCVQGNCQATTTTCTKLTCSDYAGTTDLCGPVSDGCGGTIDCGFTCSSDKVCGVVTPGKCGVVTCAPQTCEAALIGKPSGIAVPCRMVAAASFRTAERLVPAMRLAGVAAFPTSVERARPLAFRKRLRIAAQLVARSAMAAAGSCNVRTAKRHPRAAAAVIPVFAACLCANLEPARVSVPNAVPLPTDAAGRSTAEPARHPTTAAAVALRMCAVRPSAFQRPKRKSASLACAARNRMVAAVPSDCGGCTAPNTCGGGGTPSVCGSPPCTKVTCQGVGANCGPISDGCGGIIESCGTCTGTDICGAVTPSACGTAVDPNCTNLCPAIDWTCATGQETRVSGKVYAPNGVQPLNNALVYVPNKPLPAITPGPSCDRCQDEDLGDPLAAALTGPDGSFVMRNVPAGVKFPLVVKMGKWRRVVTIPAIPRCTNVDLTSDQTRLPKSMTDATSENVGYVNIPHFAIATGGVDAIECVLRQIGVADTEFTLPSGTGRIHMYRANGGTMGCKNFKKNKNGTYSTTQCASSNNTDIIQAPLSDLIAVSNGKPKINDYDVGVFDCEGSEDYHGTPYDTALHDWANAGGRLFASHYSYTYLYKNGDFASTATWGGTQQGNGNQTTGIVDTTFAKGQAFNTWLGVVGAWSPTYGSGYVSITDPREYVKSIASSTDRFIYTDSTVKIKGTQINQTSAVEQYAFNTPYQASADNICGRVLYSAFHVAGASSLGSQVFPSYCSTASMTAQEEVLEFMIFDLSACVSLNGAPPPVSCKPKTCASAGANCGQIADGCGGLLDCGTCTAPSTCGGGGVANQCGNYCTQTTCGAKGANCGIIADGCGGTLDCGTCIAPAVCGGAGTPNICGTPTCTPRSCASVGAQCGTIS